MKDDVKKMFDEERSKITREDIKDLINKENKVIDRVKKYGPLVDYLEDVKTFYALIKDYINGEYTDVPWWTIAAIGAALAYIINPFDVIPDFIPVIGYLDDAAVLTLCLKMVKKDIEKYKEWKEYKRRSKKGAEEIVSFLSDVFRTFNNNKR